MCQLNSTVASYKASTKCNTVRQYTHKQHIKKTHTHEQVNKN